jgi:hypothetical protein
MTDLMVLQSQWEPEYDENRGVSGRPNLNYLMRSADIEIHADDLFGMGIDSVRVDVEPLNAFGQPNPFVHQPPTREMVPGEDFIVVTAETDLGPTTYRVTGSGTSPAGTTVTSVPAEVTLHIGQDARVDLCSQGVRSHSIARQNPGGWHQCVGHYRAGWRLRHWPGAPNVPVTFSIDPSTTNGATLSSDFQHHGPRWEGVHERLPRGRCRPPTRSPPPPSLPNGTRPATAIQITTTPAGDLKITYVWQQTNLDWQETNDAYNCHEQGPLSSSFGLHAPSTGAALGPPTTRSRARVRWSSRARRWC